MRIDPVDAAALRAVLLKDLEAMNQLESYAKSLVAAESSRAVIESLSFALHNRYNALGNSFAQISLSFENHVKDKSRWHRELLEKMFLDVPPVRPAVLGAAMRPLLLDLLGFRHLFRHSYESALDEGKTLELFRRWERSGPEIKHALVRFAEELGSWAGDAGAPG